MECVVMSSIQYVQNTVAFRQLSYSAADAWEVQDKSYSSRKPLSEQVRTTLTDIWMSEPLESQTLNVYQSVSKGL